MKQEEPPNSGLPAEGAVVSSGDVSRSEFVSQPLSNGFSNGFPNGFSNPTPPPSRGCTCPMDIPPILLQILDHRTQPLIEHILQYMPFRSTMCYVHKEKFLDISLNFIIDKELERQQATVAASPGQVERAPTGVLSPPTDDEPAAKRQRVDGAGCGSPYYRCVVAGDPETHTQQPNAPRPGETRPLQAFASQADAQRANSAMLPPLLAQQPGQPPSYAGRSQQVYSHDSETLNDEGHMLLSAHVREPDSPVVDYSGVSKVRTPRSEASRTNGTTRPPSSAQHNQHCDPLRADRGSFRHIPTQLSEPRSGNGTVAAPYHAQQTDAPIHDQRQPSELIPRRLDAPKLEGASFPPIHAQQSDISRLEYPRNPQVFYLQPKMGTFDRGMHGPNHSQHPLASGYGQPTYPQVDGQQPRPGAGPAGYGVAGFVAPPYATSQAGLPRFDDMTDVGPKRDAAQYSVREADPCEAPRNDPPSHHAPSLGTPRIGPLQAPRHNGAGLGDPSPATSTFGTLKPEAVGYDGPQPHSSRPAAPLEHPMPNGETKGASGYPATRFDGPQRATSGYNEPVHDAPRLQAPQFITPATEAPKPGAPQQSVPSFDAPRSDGPAPGLLVDRGSWHGAPRLNTAYDNDFRHQVMQELQARKGIQKSMSHGNVTARLIYRLLQVAQYPGPDEALLLSGDEAAVRLETGVPDCPVFTEGQQQFAWAPGSRPIVEMFRRMENLNRNVSVQIPSRQSHNASFAVRKLLDVQKRFLESVTGEADDPWNILDLRNPLPPTVMPRFLAGENCQLLSRVRDSVLSGNSAERTVAAKEKWNEWLDVMDWVLMSEGGHHTAPHMDSHGLSTWITIQEGQFGFGWLSKPTEEERKAWMNKPSEFTGGRWRFTVLTPGKTVFFPSGTIHFVFRLKRGQTLALGGHVLQWTGIERWISVLCDQMRNSSITNEDVEWSAPKYLRVVSDLVKNRLNSGRVEELGGQEVVNRFLAKIPEFEKEKATKEAAAKEAAKEAAKQAKAASKNKKKKA
ncbi:hypothetical protein GE09DRAFT_1227534 [Coniochaeta sp. 2T2.1]|nr:hypothetical protein GE09DRAFT_1227534 [Coniochaeta sp. 2T2.1]